MSSLSRHDLSILVLVDAQEKLCKAMPDFEATTRPKIVNLLKAAHSLAVKTIVTEQYPKGLGHTVPEVKEALATITPVIEKTSFSCWGCDSFRNAVQIIRPRSIILIGMETHVCIQQTAIDALKEGYRVVIAADAVCSRNDYDRAISLALLREKGATITTVEAIAFDWLRDAKNPKFKEVSKLFR